MKHTKSCFLLLLIAFSGLADATASETATLFEAKAEEVIRVRTAGQGDRRRTVVEQQKIDYHHVTLWGTGPDMPDRQVVAKETLRQVMDHGREGVESNLRVDLYFASKNLGKFPAKPTRTLEIPGAHEARFENGYWTATTLGCCDAEPYTRMYGYESDRPFLRYNNDFWKIEVPNARGLDRYIGFVVRAHVPNDAAKTAIFGNQAKAVAALSLAAEGKPLHTVYVAARMPDAEQTLALHAERLEVQGTTDRDEFHPDVRLVTLWSLDGAQPENADAQAVSGVRVTAGLYLDDGTTETLEVEIRSDRFVNPRVAGSRLQALLPGSDAE